MPAAPGKYFLSVSLKEVEVFLQSNKNTKRSNFYFVCGSFFVYLCLTVLHSKIQDFMLKFKWCFPSMGKVGGEHTVW